MKVIERIANIAIIVAVAVFLFVVIRGDLTAHRISPAPPQNLIGKTLSNTGAEFPKDRSSIVLVLSTQCHFCRDSLPFYKLLSEKVRGKLNVVALLPEPQAEGQAYMRAAGVEANQVLSSSLDSIGVRGTPTVLLVDGSGVVKRSWVGMLDEKGQEKLLESVLPRSRAREPLV